MTKTIRKAFLMLTIVAFFGVLGVNKQNVNAQTPDQASALPITGQWGDRIHFDRPDNETRWYKFTVASDGILTMNMLTYSSEAVNYELYNEELTSVYEIDDNELQLGSETSPKAAKCDVALVRGTYYLKFKLTSGGDFATSDIKMKSSFKKINTNSGNAGSFDSPKDLKIGQKIVGIVSKVNKQNWFRFTVKKKTILQFKAKTFCKEFFTYDFKNADGQDVYNGSNELQNASESSPSSAIQYYTFEKGTYYLVFNDYNNGSGGNGGRYELSLNNLKKTKITKAKKTRKNKAVLHWSKVEGAYGYEVRYGTSKNKLKKLTTDKPYATLTKIMKKKKYFVKVRAYRSFSDDGDYYTGWTTYKKF